jgi:hypothetical protein
MSAACFSTVLFTATSASRAASFSRATSAALARSAAIRMDFNEREQRWEREKRWRAYVSACQAAAERVGEETRDSEPDEDLSILYDAADTEGYYPNAAHTIGGPHHPNAAHTIGHARCQTSAAQIGQLLATRSAADQRRAYEAAAEAARQAAGADVKRAAQDAFLASLAQPRSTRADSAKELLQTIKDAGIAGVISFGLVQAAFWGALTLTLTVSPTLTLTLTLTNQAAFWGASLPVCLVAYGLASGHWPDLGDQEDVAKFSAEAFAYVNVARLAAPLRVGAALSFVPWVQANVVDRFSRGGK